MASRNSSARAMAVSASAASEEAGATTAALGAGIVWLAMRSEKVKTLSNLSKMATSHNSSSFFHAMRRPPASLCPGGAPAHSTCSRCPLSVALPNSAMASLAMSKEGNTAMATPTDRRKRLSQASETSAGLKPCLCNKASRSASVASGGNPDMRIARPAAEPACCIVESLLLVRWTFRVKNFRFSGFKFCITDRCFRRNSSSGGFFIRAFT
mmetsp:Transcript_98447/g.283019  ORF Transcript_98447/g.283019 Transcript_98447/m.283019 type:complete len:211 (+) Transcript_98447:183-815(+)